MKYFLTIILALSLVPIHAQSGGTGAQEENPGIEEDGKIDIPIMDYTELHGGRNGGDGPEIKLGITMKEMAEQIVEFLKTDIGKKEFPDVPLRAF